MKNIKIACIGEALLELNVPTVPGSAQVAVAGDVLNTAVYLRRLLPSHFSVSFVSLLGQDRLSQDIASFISGQGVDTELLWHLPGKLPGSYAITTDENGERSFQYWRNQSAARSLFSASDCLSLDMLETFDIIYCSGITLAILPHKIRLRLLEWIKSFSARKGSFVFDSNYRPVLWESQSVAREIIHSAWKSCDIALPSVDDEMALFDEASAYEVLMRFSDYSQCTGALKQGNLGPRSINIPLQTLAFPKAEKVVDTTAAGDGFNAGYLSTILQDKSPSEALIKGHEQALKIVAHHGAILPN